MFRPNTCYADDYVCVASVTTSPDVSPLPRSVRDALRDPNWVSAMREEFTALVSNRTWELVPHPPRANIITGK